MAAMRPVDDDGDIPIGLFVLSDERGAVSVGDVRDGMVHDRACSRVAMDIRK
jgi:hypothetical protein